MFFKKIAPNYTGPSQQQIHSFKDFKKIITFAKEEYKISAVNLVSNLPIAPAGVQ
jgi:hypothetical protein